MVVVILYRHIPGTAAVFGVGSNQNANPNKTPFIVCVNRDCF
jgi:hypothetical protein